LAAVTGQRVTVPAETRLTFVLAAPPPAPVAAPARPAPARAVVTAPLEPRPASVAPAPTSTLTASYSQIQFRITEVVGQGTTLTVTLTALNQGVDRKLTLGLPYVYGGAGAVSIVDNVGSSYDVTKVIIGNQDQSQQSPTTMGQEIINGITTPIVLIFEKLNTVGGQMQAASIARLQLAPVINYDTRNFGRVEFRNLPIQKQ
jgi:hypothetical protein